jgi:hypothetical protein
MRALIAALTITAYLISNVGALACGEERWSVKTGTD